MFQTEVADIDETFCIMYMFLCIEFLMRKLTNSFSELLPFVLTDSLWYMFKISVFLYLVMFVPTC